MTTLRTKDERGFTLVELLVVIIIIGILAAIAIPVFLNQRQRANDATLQSDMKNIAIQLNDYFAGNGSWEQVRTVTGRENQIRVIGDGTTPEWNDFAELPPLNATEGTIISVYYRGAPAPPYWNRAHEHGEFCLVGKRAVSNYDGNGNPSTLLYYDTYLGGIKKIEDIANSVTEEPSCAGNARQYLALIAAGG